MYPNDLTGDDWICHEGAFVDVRLCDESICLERRNDRGLVERAYFRRVDGAILPAEARRSLCGPGRLFPASLSAVHAGTASPRVAERIDLYLALNEDERDVSEATDAIREAAARRRLAIETAEREILSIARDPSKSIGLLSAAVAALRSYHASRIEDFVARDPGSDLVE